MVDPAGQASKIDKTNPIRIFVSDIKTELIKVPLKLLFHCIAVTVGKIIKLEINNVPTTRIPTKIAKAVMMASPY
jgi:hypothetical protein